MHFWLVALYCKMFYECVCERKYKLIFLRLSSFKWTVDSICQFQYPCLLITHIINWQCATKFSNKSWKEEEKIVYRSHGKISRVGNMDARLVLRCLSEPESEAGLRSVRISEIAQKLTEIATYFSNEPFLMNLTYQPKFLLYF